VLRLLASQAAISLENAHLYTDLQHAEALLAEAQRLSHTGSFDWHVSSGELFWSAASFRIFGYDPATKPTVETVLNRVHPNDVALVQQTIEHAADNREGFDFEHRLLWQLDAQPLIATTNDLQGVEDLSAYIDDHPDFLRLAAELSIIEEVNDYAVQMFGAHDRSELLGSMRWVWRESLDTLRRAMESRYRGDELFQETTKLPTLDGRVIDALYTVARPRISDNSGLTLVSLVDLTERVRAQEMLQRVQADVAHAARISTLGELTASIARELNQPLAAITTNGEAGLRWLDRPFPA
jgi:PAS domain S-box-containing protein